MDQVRAYRMFQKMAQYPHLLDEMREIFLTSLTERGIINEETIQLESRQKIQQSHQEEASPELLREYTNALIDLYFASHFNDTEIEDYINLARKRDRFRHLNTILNTEDATSAAIHQALKEFCVIPEGHLFIPPNEAEVVRVALISRFISGQLPFVGIAKKHLTTRDIYDVVEHSVWNESLSGKVGGKAAGMLLAYRVILPRFEAGDPDIEKHVILPKSYYFNSGILSDFIEYNDLHDCYSVKYKPQETLEKTYHEQEAKFEEASFPPSVMDQFRVFLETVGEIPLILRSSSRLEDSPGNAFSGKYQSVFITNQGALEDRLKGFVRGLKQVLLSLLNPSAIAYRRERNLLDFDERMSALVQEVAGRRFGNYFFPLAAGAAFSINRYKWSPRINEHDGLVRMVFGLGTRAVDRIGGDYARMVPLSHPRLRPEITAAQIQKYSQKMVDVLNLEKGVLETVSYIELFQAISHPDLYYAVSISEDSHLSPPMFKGKSIEPDNTCITFDNLLAKTPFVPLMKKILGKLQEAYQQPVEVEFAWDGDKLYLLQCRSHPAMEELGDVDLPEDIDPEQILFSNNRGTSNSVVKNIEYVVYVDPKAYDQLRTPQEKLDVGRAVGDINRTMESKSKRYALWGPGRWGSNDINLGVKVGYEDINRSLILGEVCFGEPGSAPEASYGTHFFNDLVEARIIPMAIYPDDEGVGFKEDFFLEAPNQFVDLAPSHAKYKDVVHVIHIPSCTAGRLLHVFQDGRSQRGLGFFAHDQEVFT
ncbi:MAG: hypothetical protein HY788_04490 [Deltaproteobacteria bacterium]|nr:hypothetical protein [Deltaproteobacteria bacterium]